MARLVLSLVAAIVLLASAATAQQPVPAQPQWEGRLAGALTPSGGALAGVGVNVRAGWYSRVGIAATAGAVQTRGGWSARQRVDGTARFLFDPFAERRRGFYAGAGIGVERFADGFTRGLLLGVVGVEGTPAGRVVPSVELMLGGGTRLGVVLRGRRRQGR